MSSSRPLDRRATSIRSSSSGGSFSDQPDNALRETRLRVGEMLPPARFTESQLAATLERLLTSSDVAAACRQCREKIASVNAVGLACDLIEKQFEQRH